MVKSYFSSKIIGSIYFTSHIKKILFLIGAFFLLGNFGYGQATFSAAGTYNWTCPPGVTTIQVEAWGAGGAGGGTGATGGTVRTGGGGGGGAYTKNTSISVTPGTSYIVVVGAVATGVSAGAGNNGGNSTFASTLVVANGGKGGGATNSGTGGTSGLGGAAGTYSGGNGAAGLGTTAGSGGGGSSAGTSSNGNNGSVPGAGAAPAGGAAGAAGATGNGAGNAAPSFGGGGSGGYAGTGSTTARAGGAGGTGRVVLTYTGYCTPLSFSSYYITSVSTSGATTNFSNTSTNGNGYSNFYDTKQIIATAGGSFTVSFGGVGAETFGWAIWIDWNKNNVFDSGERVHVTSGYLNNGTSGSITIPVAQAAGDYVMRVLADYNNNAPSSSCSFNLNSGEAEDYKLTVTAASMCTMPAAQPTALLLTSITATTLSGSFTAASPAPSKYLIVRSTSATAPAPVNGTIYAVASTTLGAGTYVVSNGTATIFSDTSLTSNTQYYYYIFSYNDSCTGAPYYLTTAPLTANTYTCLATPTSNAGTVVTGSGFTANWTAVTGATGYLLDVSTVNTFASFVAGYNGLVLSGGSSISQAVSGLTANTTYYYRVRATNATSCISASSSIQSVFTGHCVPTATAGTGTYINSFTTTGGTANITNSSSGFTAGAYQDNYATMLTSQYAGNIINFSFALVGGTAGVAIWVDWNSNLVFETSERVYNSAATIATGTYTGAITVPAAQPLGNYRMRIKTDYLSGNPDPCTTSSTRTESEDYKFTVIAAPTDAVDYANIQSPGVSTTTTGTPVDIYGQAYEPGITNPAGAATGLSVWYSTNATDVDPSSAGWTGIWTVATFNTNVGNNDEWKGTINPIIGQANTYYSFRYQLNGGPFKYGGYNASGGGFWDGTTNKNGKLSVNYEVYTNSAPKTINDQITINFKDFDATNMFYTGTETTIYAYAGIRIVGGSDFNYAQGNINTISSLIPFTLSGGIYRTTIKLADYFCIPAGVNVDGVNMIFRNPYFTGGNCDGTTGNNDKTCNLYLDLTDALVVVNPPTAVANNTVTVSGATISWTAPVKGTNKAYEYYVSTSATTPASGVTPVIAATASPVIISGLLNSTTYYVYVRTVGCGSDKSTWSSYTSFKTLSPPPANDACANATVLPCATAALAGTTVGSVSETISVTGWSTSAYGVWYTFVGDGTLNTITSVAGSGFDHTISVASGTCGSLTNVGTIDDSGSGGTETISFYATLGTAYYVYISYYGTGTTTGTFNISRTCGVIPTYCTAHTDYASETYIDDVQFIGTLNDVSNLNSSFTNSPSGYQNFTALPKSIQAQGEGINVYVNGNTQARIYAWVDWNRDGDFSDTGEQVYDSAAGTTDTTFGFVIPTVTVPGDYRIRIRNGINYYDYNSDGTIDLDEEIYFPSFDSCVDFEETTYFGDDDLYYGEAEDYLFTVIANCFATINAVTDGSRCGPGTVPLTATGSAETTAYLWYANQTGGAPLQNSASNTYIPTISATTTFYVTASNGTCESLIRKPIVANMKDIPSVSFTPLAPIACGDKNPIMLSAASDNETVYLINENFDGSGLGLFNNQNIVGNGTTINQISKWEKKSSPFVPGDGADVWTPSISSGYGANKFAFSTSDVGPKTTTPQTYYTIDHGLALTAPVNTTAYSDLTLKFRAYFSRYIPNTVVPTAEYLAVETSTNGTTWTPVSGATYISDLGTPGNFQQVTVNMNSFINIATLQFRIRYYASSWYDGVAVDDIQLYGTKPLVASFTWSGSTDISVYTDAAATIAYIPGAVEDIVYVLPNASLLATPSFNIDVTTQLTNGCSVTKTIPVTNKSKVWNGSTSAAWETASNWSPAGIPTATDCIIIPSTAVKPVISNLASGKNLEVKSSGELLVNAEKILAIEDGINVNAGGKLTFENSASLLQTNEDPAINKGNIIYKRNSSDMLRYSYTYWSSPVYATTQTLNALSSGTLADKYFSWDINNQEWLLHANGNVTMEKGKGYIVRAPQTFPTTGTAAPYSATFNGVPNNGTFTIATQGSTNPAVEKFNLIGNPYPSAMHADAFLLASTNPALEGTIYLWTNFAGLSTVRDANGHYSYTDDDYAAYNFSGGTSTAATESTAPAMGDNVLPTGYIAAGQSFFVKGVSNGAGVANFNNTMRVGSNNNQFFRNGNASQSLEKHRFWLNLENSQGGFNQALIAYIQGATNNYDRGFDGEVFGGNSATFYSIAEKNLSIQGKGLPFEASDVIPMGYKATVPDNYKITLDHFDGLFSSQDIYLKDNLLGTIHDLKSGAYSFATAIGTFNSRFEIVYNPESLGVNDPSFDPNSIVIYKKSKEIFVNAGLLSINELKVFDIQGRLIYHDKNINSSEAVIKNLPQGEQVLVVQVKTAEGNIISKKIVY